jgi:CheY-like chemotaxis protein
METDNGSPRRRHVVIVDDNAELAWFFSEILKLHGYSTAVLTDGKLALKYVLSQPVDAIICDLQMRQLDGDLFYATVERTHPALLRRFIFVTGMADEERFRKFVSTVAVPVLRKPVAVEALLSAVERASR